MEMRISETEEREVLASLGFDINESKRRRVVVSSSTTARRYVDIAFRCFNSPLS